MMILLSDTYPCDGDISQSNGPSHAVLTPKQQLAWPNKSGDERELDQHEETANLQLRTVYIQ
jgi:hypothetical protein